MRLFEFDDRKTAYEYQLLDGVGRNAAITSAIIAEAKRKLAEMHAAILDLAKSFQKQSVRG